MDSFSMPSHKKLWRKDFIILIIAELMITASVYMQIPLFLQRYINSECTIQKGLGVAVSMFGIGLFAIGPFTNWLIQRYRRNKVFIFSTAGMLSVLLFMSVYGYESRMADESAGILLKISCFLFGCFYSLSKRTLTGVLMIDKCESYNRTDANIAASWVSRFSLSVGPAVAVIAMTMTDSIDTDVMANACIAVAILLVCMIRFPFKSPDENVNIISTDRFFYSHDIKYFILLAAIYVVIGLIVSFTDSVMFYGFLSAGFAMAMIGGHYFVRSTKRLSGIIGLVCMLTAFIFIILCRCLPFTDYTVPLLLGCGTGYIGSYVLHKYIDAGIHCERSTAISSYFLACEGGFAGGICISYMFIDNQIMAQFHKILQSFLNCY